MAQKQYYHSVGKRKTSIAQVKLYIEPGGIIVNGKPLEEVFPWAPWQSMVREPLEITKTTQNYSIEAKIRGGGVSSQAAALRHGIARALASLDENLRKYLKQHGLLTRDSRIKESKKYGLKRARKAEQYSKR